jgi:hypothetical protein
MCRDEAVRGPMIVEQVTAFERLEPKAEERSPEAVL